MENNSGMRKILSLPGFYNFFQRLSGGDWMRRWLAENIWSVTAGEKVVDMGCGPGHAFTLMPSDVRYMGFDISEAYISHAKKKFRFNDNALFLTGSIRDFLERSDTRLDDADLVICNGLLHHLDDSDCRDVFRLAHRIMLASGRFVCIEPVFLLHQDPLSRWIMNKDRGAFIRTEREWKDLFDGSFASFRTNIVWGLGKVRYFFIVIECFKKER